jgi:hypothetical protein
MWTNAVLVGAVALTFALYRTSRAVGEPPGRVATRTDFTLFGVGDSPSYDGLVDDHAAEDWLLLRSALRTRLGKHVADVEVVDARQSFGSGPRQLLVYARPGTAVPCEGDAAPAGTAWACVAPPPGEGEGAPQPHTPGGPLLLISVWEHGVSGGTEGASAAGARGGTYFVPRRKSASAGGRAGGGEAATPTRSGPARGKSGRAFGAAQRGPGLAARSGPRGAGAPLALSLRLHVQLVGLTCWTDWAGQGQGSCGENATVCGAGVWPGAPVLRLPTTPAALLAALASASSGSGAASGASLGREGSWAGALVGAVADVERLRLARVQDADGLPVPRTLWGLDAQKEAAGSASPGTDRPPRRLDEGGASLEL